MTSANAVYQTNLPLPNRRQGKVRDIYALPPSGGKPGRVVIVATDRISAFDVVLPTPVPGKGKLLTEISVHWFEFIRKLGLVGDHLISTDPADLPDLSPVDRELLEGRVMIGRAAKVIPIECVARGYITGSGWTEYQQTGKVCGIELPKNLRECEQLPQPIFTPATKADVGHDENIDFDTAARVVGRPLMEKLRDLTLRIYSEAAAYARTRGIIMADTKFEFGWALDAKGQPTDEVILIDEVLTPDSSRFWPASEFQPGRNQRSFDKQYVRDYLQGLVKAGQWDKTPPGPPLPEEIVRNTLARYEEARDRLFG
ncbi:MAG: phosphoribosylaminoimidazolesuccinocarboxamide synthase [Phycisphaeraceae bacterium]|nr:MAG: phosphoribosylaminoimidazolesuccinocarboxamide synthase [Phycisphaeraceae bacterium]